MLSKLTIRNYALIDQLEIAFDAGFSTITGETGSGKSILLGALGLVLGKRADKSAMRDPEEKCVVEAEWDVSAYHLKEFFGENDLDYEPLCILRREITPSGKSRSFVNDSPVSLGVLVELGGRLLDIHSQNDTPRLLGAEFQLALLDSWADNATLLADYRDRYRQWKQAVRELSELTEQQLAMTREQDYQQFLLNELDEARLDGFDLKQCEQERDEHAHSERIREHLTEISDRFEAEEIGLLSQLRRLSQLTDDLASYSERFAIYRERMRSALLELQDIQSELAPLADAIELDPARLVELEHRLETIYRLQAKHQTAEIEELKTIREDLRAKLSGIELNAARKEELETVISRWEEELWSLGSELSQRRKSAITPLVERLTADLARLGMPKARVRIELGSTDQLSPLGLDEVDILFSANPGQNPGPIRKVASGGELSRIMLVIKAIMARRQNLPTLIFDEIDTGVSGEVSDQMGAIMREMGADMQVISITHIPQIAAKGTQHFKVSKLIAGGQTRTNIELLTAEQRVDELAEMLSGKNAGESARLHARELLRPEAWASRDI